MFDEQQEILLGFVLESKEMLDEVEPLLMDLERMAVSEGVLDKEMINTVFRLFHSLKGGAGFLDLNTVSKVTHEAETLLDRFRKGEGKLNSGHIDLMTRACDFIRGLLDSIEENLNDHGFDDEAAEMIAALREALANLANESDESPAEDIVEEMTIDLGEFESAPDVEDVPIEQPEIDAIEEFTFAVTPEMVAAFTSEAQEQLEIAEESLIGLEKHPEDEDALSSAFRAFHSLKGNAGMLGFSDVEKIGHDAESAMDKIRNGAILADQKVFNLLLEIIDFIRQAVNSVSQGGKANIPAAPGLMSLLKDAVSNAPDGPNAKEEAEKAAAAAEMKKAEKAEAVAKKDAKPKAQAKAKPAAAKPKPVKKPVAKKAKAVEPGKGERRNAQRNTVRVDVEKLDVLLDLIGELVIVEAMVVQNPDIRDLHIPMERFDYISPAGL